MVSKYKVLKQQLTFTHRRNIGRWHEPCLPCKVAYNHVTTSCKLKLQKRACHCSSDISWGRQMLELHRSMASCSSWTGVNSGWSGWDTKEEKWGWGPDGTQEPEMDNLPYLKSFRETQIWSVNHRGALREEKALTAVPPCHCPVRLHR